MDVNGKLDTKDMTTEMELFETEMEIKSSCINGKVSNKVKGSDSQIYPLYIYNYFWNLISFFLPSENFGVSFLASSKNRD